VTRDGLLAKAGPLKTDQDFFIVDAPFPPLLTKKDVESGSDLDLSTVTSQHGDKEGKDGDLSLDKEASFKGVKASGSAAKTGSGQSGKWNVHELSKAIKSITGVLEVGIFSGLDGIEAEEQGVHGGQKPVAVYFGMTDGSVKVRTAPGRENPKRKS